MNDLPIVRHPPEGVACTCPHCCPDKWIINAAIASGQLGELQNNWVWPTAVSYAIDPNDPKYTAAAQIPWMDMQGVAGYTVPNTGYYPSFLTTTQDIEVWNEDKKVVVYTNEVWRYVNGELISKHPRTLQNIQDTFDWLYKD